MEDIARPGTSLHAISSSGLYFAFSRLLLVAVAGVVRPSYYWWHLWRVGMFVLG